MKVAASPKVNLLVEFRVRPVPSVCVNVVSPSAPKAITELSDNNFRSSPSTASLTTDNPPSVCSDPSVVDVASVASSVFSIPVAVTAPLKLIIFPLIVKSVPSPSIFSASSPKVIPTFAGTLISLVAVRLISAPEFMVRSVLLLSIFSEALSSNTIPTFLGMCTSSC